MQDIVFKIVPNLFEGNPHGVYYLVLLSLLCYMLYTRLCTIIWNLFLIFTDEEAKEHAFYEERGMPVPKKETEGI